MSQHGDVKNTALIDWFRFTCMWHFNVLDPSTREVLELLKLNPDHSSAEGNDLYALNYESTLIYDEDVKVGINPSERAKIKGVTDQFVIDLSGQACRHFEARGGSWIELISKLSSLPIRFNRIDLALDDIDGYLDVKLLKEKIANQEFISAFRGKKENGKIGDEIYSLAFPEEDDLAPNPRLIDSRKGYTCSFGARNQPVFLNIYDKLMERSSKGIVAGVREWIRFEVSFIREKCETVVRKLVLPSLKDETFGKTVSGIMRGLIEFKEGKQYDRETNRHMCRLPIWRQYSKFLGGAEKIKVPSDQAKVEQSVTRTIEWAKGYWLGSLIKLFGCGQYGFNEILAEMSNYLDDKGISWKLISQIKNYLHSKGENKSTEAILEDIQAMVDTFGGTADVAGVFKRTFEKEKERMKESSKFISDLMVEDDLESLEDYKKQQELEAEIEKDF